jgi:hypothetical protein
MPENRIRRKLRSFDVTVATSAAGSTAIRWDEAAGGNIQLATQVTAASFATTLQVWAANSTGGTFSRLYDSNGVPANVTLVQDSVNQTSYAMPDAAFSAGAIKLVAGSTHLTSATVSIKT